MPRWSPSNANVLAAVLVAALVPSGASAQMGGGMQPMGPGGMGAPPGQGAQTEKEQVAEQAPETPAETPALQPLPAFPGQEEKKLQIFEIHGYMRGRYFWFHQLSLGVRQSASGPNPPFWVPYSEFGATGDPQNPGPASSCAARKGESCASENISTADMRLRLDPSITVTDQVKVFATIDIFDNLVAGSTPEGYFINGQGPSADVQLQAFSRSQAPPEVGRNSIESSIRVKRAWAEVKTPIGKLSFGRQPSHWGMGMLINNGNCLDCDYGANADRIMFATKLFNHFLALFYDWVATGPTTRLYTQNQLTGPTYNADPLDDVFQIGGAIGRRDEPGEVKERVDAGKVVVNYGGYFVYRRQDWDITNNPGVGQPNGVLAGTTARQLQMILTPRDAWAFIPDLWFRLNYKKFQLELEGAIIYGKIGTVSDRLSRSTGELEILQGGFVARADYRLLHDALHLGVEIGFASGDSAEDRNANVNFRLNQIIRPVGQTRITNFLFDPDYHVDMILWRRIVGTVTNATYFKATGAYDILDNLRARADVIYSLANEPVGWPGNSINLGLELNASLLYHNDEEGFYAGFAYGVLFPFAGLGFPGNSCDERDIARIGGCAIYGTAFANDPSIAQTVQARAAVRF